MSDAKTPEEHRKKLARAKINNALRDGRIKKPTTCHICGKHTSKLQFHHTDYRNPKKGYWICASCHKKTTDKNNKK